MNQTINILLDDNIKVDNNAFELVRKMTELPYVEHVAVVPDFHFKNKMEAPSSIAVATGDCMVPHFTSCSLNCGMGLLNTQIRRRDFDLKATIEFFRQLRATEHEREVFDINHSELERTLRGGAEYICEKYSLPFSWLDKVEERGKLATNGKPLELDVDDILDRDDLRNPNYQGLRNLGLGFGGNHFVELQEVTEIIDTQLCRDNGIRLGDTVIMYHGGGGIVPGFIGGYFANRLLGYSNDMRLLYNKVKFHFGTLKNLNRFNQRWKYYFSKKRFVQIQEETPEGIRVNAAHAASMNYGYAYRMVAVARLLRALRKGFSEPNLRVELLHDSSHNHILKEVLDGKPLWLHRHNCCRVNMKSLNILPGFHTTSSYIGIGLNGAKKYLNTMPHGAGHTINQYCEAGISVPIPNRMTQKFEDISEQPIEVQHISDEGIDSVVHILLKNSIFKPIARLTPFAVLKNYYR